MIIIISSPPLFNILLFPFYELNEKEIDQPDFFKHAAIATPYMDLIDEFTVEEMVKFHFSFKEIRDNKSGEEIIDCMGLGHARHKAITNFSSGMRQRLKVGLAFHSKCNALFLDEPTTNLDKKAIDWYNENLAKVRGNTLVFIASNQAHEYPTDAHKLDVMTFKKGY